MHEAKSGSSEPSFPLSVKLRRKVSIVKSNVSMSFDNLWTIADYLSFVSLSKGNVGNSNRSKSDSKMRS